MSQQLKRCQRTNKTLNTTTIERFKIKIYYLAFNINYCIILMVLIPCYYRYSPEPINYNMLIIKKILYLPPVRRMIPFVQEFPNVSP